MSEKKLDEIVRFAVDAPIAARVARAEAIDILIDEVEAELTRRRDVLRKERDGLAVLTGREFDRLVRPQLWAAFRVDVLGCCFTRHEKNEKNRHRSVAIMRPNDLVLTERDVPRLGKIVELDEKIFALNERLRHVVHSRKKFKSEVTKKIMSLTPEGRWPTKSRRNRRPETAGIPLPPSARLLFPER